MSSQQQQEEEEPRSWQQQQQTSSGGAGAGNSSSAGGTPIRRTDNKSSVRLSEFIPAGSSSEWRHLTSSPSRVQQQQRSSARNSPHCWSSENLLTGANNKDSSGMTASWTPAGSDQSGSAQPTGVQGGVEPFIPPPPLLDFETANLLPPLGVDVSSPSDDLHFMPVSGADGAGVGQESGGVNWVQIPSQYATLRRPRSNNGNVRSAMGDGYSTLRRPRSSSNNVHQQHGQVPGGSSWLMDPSNSSDHHQHHHQDSNGVCHLMGRDGLPRKCTCGQKMRIQQHPSAASSAGSDRDSHIRSDDGLAGIATIRRPVKRKTRNQIPSQLLTSGAQSGSEGGPPSPGILSNNGGGNPMAATGATSAALPKLETSVLLDKLLRAGALRPEDYLVLSRMERMIMANHLSSAGQQQQSARIRPPSKLGQPATASSPADSGVDMRREFELNTTKMSMGGQVSTESLYDTQGGQQHLVGYPRRSSASSDRTGMNSSSLMQLPTSGGPRSERPSPGPPPMDYYYRPDPQHHHVQRNEALFQQPPPNLAPSAGRCCPCCGSPSHPQQQLHHHSTCNLCGGGPHQHQSTYSAAGSAYAPPKMQQQPPPAYSATVYSSASTRQHYPAGSDMMATKYPTVTPAQQHHSTGSLMSIKNPPPSNSNLRPELQQHPMPISNEPALSRFPMVTNGAQQQGNPSGPILHRSISTPARTIQQQQSAQPGHAVQSASTGGDPLQHRASLAPNHRVGLTRSLSRTEAVKEYFKQSAATFFGLDESKESELRQRWEDRRRRLAERRCGTLREQSVHDENVESRDLVDGGGTGESLAESADGVCGLVEGPTGSTSTSASQLLLQHHHKRLKRRESVARMTWDGLAYLATAIVRLRGSGSEEESVRSRSISNTLAASNSTAAANGATGLTASRLRVDTGASASAAAGTSGGAAPMPPDVTMDTGGTANMAAETALEDEVFFDVPPPPYEDVVDSAGHVASSTGQPLGGVGGRHRQDSEPRSARWRRAIQSPPSAPTSASLVDRLMDNSNRRQYGMGVVGRLTRRSIRQSMVENDKHLKSQLDSFEDHRPYFTYWTCTVQVLIMLIALITYGLGPIGFNLHRRSGSVLVTSLSLQEVDYYEPSNFWIGPRAADLIHLGAKYSPCMKPDTRIRADIEATRIRERQTACCIRNDNSGCVQTSRAECSDLTSTWKKWNVVQSGPGGRISGSVCGQDPNFCIEPASVAPFEWPDDITKWPKCRKKLPGLGSESKTNANHVLKTTGQAEHMVCEVIGHPCCIGIHGDCRIATREYCDFVKGYFHQEASLCSQVSCMNDVCGMLPFHTPDVSDQFYRLWTSLFLHAGILHLAVSVTFQMIIMRDLEKLAGPLRIGIIYIGSGVVGNLASALFVPYRAEVGPSGSHFGLLACLCVEVLHAWPLLRTPWRALGRLLLTVAFLFVAGLLPWIDNFAHIFGFISGGLLSYTFLPFITVGLYDRRRKLVLIGVTLTLCAVLLTTLVLLLYVWPIQDSGVIQTLGYLNCVPITRDFCAEQNIHFNKREISIT